MKYVEFPEDDMASKDGKNKNKSNNRNASQGGSPSGGWFWTILWTILFLFLLNGLFFPGMKGSKVVETDYGQFVKDVSDSLVREVVIKDNKVYYSKGTEANDTTYFTGEVNDPELVNRLVAAGSPNLDGKIKFVKKIEQKNSPILDFILWWILPALIFYLIYVFMMRKIASRGGAGGGMGNFMSLGKSGAKVYAEDDIKTRFSDVAGQDEAKESLKEMVDFLHNPK